MSTRSKHLQELEIARNVNDPRRIMPLIGASQLQILDVGCGAGQTLIASQLADGATVVGLDPDLSALQLGRELSRRIQFVCSKGETLPFKNEYFDLVISRVAVPYMHVRPAVREMSRVLKGNGNLWIVLHPVSMTIRELRQRFWRFDLRGVLASLYVLSNGILSHLSGKELQRPFKGEYQSFQTSRGITSALTGAGFEDIEIDRTTGFVVRARKRADARLRQPRGLHDVA